MHESHEFLKNLALVLCVAAVATIVFQRLKQPVVFGYLLAGLIVGPHFPVPVVADPETVQSLAELGVILLMFSLGLEFSLRKLIAVGSTAGLIAVAQSTVMIGLGYGIGQLFGWTSLESIFAGAIIAISSTTIIVKAFAEQKVRGRTVDIVFGVLIIEDLIAIFLLVALTALASAGGFSAATLGITGARLVVFLTGLVGVGLLVVPRLMRAVVRLDRPETTLVASVGICFAFALLALSFGYSVALGAFLAGSLIAESGTAHVVERLVQPIRDMFGAIFFVSVGMLIDPALVAANWGAVTTLTLVVIVGKTVAVSVSAFLTGVDSRTSVQTGMSLGQIGEFSFIIAGLGLSTGATGSFLYPVAIAVSAVTTLTTPLLIRAAPNAAAFVDRKLPRPIQTFAALYGSWIERMRAAPREGNHTRARRLTSLVLVDALVLTALVVGVAMELPRFAGRVNEWTTLSYTTARFVVAALGGVLALPLVFGLVETARRLAIELATRALPAAAAGKVDFALAPRRALVTALQIGIVLAAGIPVVVITQPFLPAFGSAIVLGAVVLVLGIAFWRSATNLQGHARAGAEVIAMTLAKQMAKPEAEIDHARTTQQFEIFLPGLGHPVPVRLTSECPLLGMTLASANIRGLTGATILAITRAGEQILVPSGSEVLREGDVLALAGTHEAIAQAEELLNTGTHARVAAAAPTDSARH